MDPVERDAHLAYEATKRLTSRNLVIMEIACTRSSHDLFKVRQSYHVKYKKSLEEDFAYYTNGDFRKKPTCFVGTVEVQTRLEIQTSPDLLFFGYKVVMRQFGGYGGADVIIDDAEIQQHQKLEKLYISTRAAKVHPEAENGQFEIALGYTTFDKVADNLVFTREVVQAVARKHGLLATFVPKYTLDDIGSGSRLQISLFENGENVFMATGGESRHGISKIGEQFMASVLNHLPSILAFTAPVPNR